MSDVLETNRLASSPLSLQDVFGGELRKINVVMLRKLIEQETGLSYQSTFLTDMVGGLEFERDIWLDDECSPDTWKNAIHVILLKDGIANTDRIKYFQAAADRPTITADRTDLDLYFIPDIYWGDGIGCNSSPVCGGGDGGNGCCGGCDGLFTAVVFIVACCSCIAAVCAGNGLMRSTTDAEPRSVTCVKRATPVAVGIVSLWLMIQYAHSTMHDEWCAYLINRNNSTGSCEENPSESSLSTIAAGGADFSVSALNFAFTACLFSLWRPKISSELTGDMQTYVNKLQLDESVKNLVAKLETKSCFIGYLVSAKEKGPKEYAAVKIILQAMSGGSLDAGVVIIDIEPTAVSRDDSSRLTPLLKYTKGTQDAKGKAILGANAYEKL